MNSDLLKTNLSSLERKIKLLIGDHRNLKLEVDLLKIENDELRSLVKTKEEQVSSFQNQIKISKIVNKIDTGEENTSELKRKIDDYIKEIDKCIAHLSK